MREPGINLRPAVSAPAPTDLPGRMKLLHDWYCQAMGTPMRMDAAVEHYWFDWLQAGFNGQQLRKVMNYLRKEIAAKNRNAGALKLRNLLNPENFQDDLVLAGVNLDPEAKLPPSPLSERAPKP